MRKLLLVLFLFTLTSNALAKVEIWKCAGLLQYEWELSYFKLDLNDPVSAYRREGGIWKPYWTPYEDSIAANIMFNDREDHLRIIYLSFDQPTQELLFDFITSELIIKYWNHGDENKPNRIFSCER